MYTLLRNDATPTFKSIKWQILTIIQCVFMHFIVLLIVILPYKFCLLGTKIRKIIVKFKKYVFLDFNDFSQKLIKFEINQMKQLSKKQVEDLIHPSFLF